MRFIVHFLLSAAAAYWFARWAKDQSDQQIRKMQTAVFNTPGAEAPVPPAVAGAAMSLLGALWTVGRRLLRLGRGATLFGLVGGAAGGIVAFTATTMRPRNDRS